MPSISADLPAWPEVDPQWMTLALQQRFAGCVVDGVEVLLHDDGTNRRARLGLTYSSGAGPRQVFVKASDPAHAKVNAATGGILNEARLFGLEVELGVEHPAAYFAVVDAPALAFVLVMEDVTLRGADPRDATRPLSVDQAASGVRGLAALHSGFWSDRLDRNDRLGWVEPYAVWKMKMELGIQIGLQRAESLLPDSVRAMSAHEIESVQWARYVESLSTGPQTLLHGDAHIGNTYVLPDDTIGFLDWQVLRRGHPTIDLGYFLQGALSVADRRAHEADLVAQYLRALALPADELPDRDDFWLRYRASTAHGLCLWLATAASDTWQRPEVSLALVERYAAAYDDLDSATAIGSLRSD